MPKLIIADKMLKGYVIPDRPFRNFGASKSPLHDHPEL